MEKQKPFEPVSLILIILLYVFLMYPLSSLSKGASEHKSTNNKAFTSQAENELDVKSLTEEKSKGDYMPFVRDASSGL